MLHTVGVAILVLAVALTCWPGRFRVAKDRAELIGGGLFVVGLVVIGMGLSTYFR